MAISMNSKERKTRKGKRRAMDVNPWWSCECEEEKERKKRKKREVKETKERRGGKRLAGSRRSRTRKIKKKVGDPTREFTSMSRDFTSVLHEVTVAT